MRRRKRPAWRALLPDPFPHPFHGVPNMRTRALILAAAAVLSLIAAPAAEARGRMPVWCEIVPAWCA